MSTALITGAGRGLGRELARVFHAAGFRLLLSTHSTPITDYSDAVVVYGDLADAHVIDELSSRAVEMGVSALVNNAGVYVSGPTANISEKTVRHLIEVNLVVPMLLTQRLWSTLAKNRGVVLNINSVAGKVGGRGEAAYSASKHGLRGFSGALQFDATRDGVRVFDVYLGGMRTDMARARADVSKFIDPREAADVLVTLALCGYDSMRVTEVELVRRNY
jgi:NAD(P)-dependent dehydrogenase (short-subunit alcohol dehydrogenase family)